MSEVKRYVHKPEKMQKVSRFYGPNSERQYTLGKDFDRVTAERDAALAQESTLARDAANWKRKACESADREHELQQRLTAADDRADVLEGLVGEVLDAVGREPLDLDAVLRLRARMRAALKPAEVKCKTCNGTRIVSDGAMYCSSGGIPFECGPIECVKDCPDCSKQ